MRNITLYVLLIRVYGIIIILLMSGCAVSWETLDAVGPATVTMKTSSTINGIHRTALVHIPEGYDPGKKYPLVVVIHGAFSTAAKMEQETGFSTLADQEGFVVVYPNGMGIFGLLQHWNAGHCCGKAAKDNLDDVAFIRECIEQVAEKLNIDRKRIYLTGFSNGGMLVYTYVAANSSRVAAFAALGAAVGGRDSPEKEFWLPQSPESPVPALIIHGSDDQAIPVQGGVSPKKNGSREYLSLQESVQFWLGANKCEKKRESESSFKDKVRTYHWRNCSEQTKVELHILEGWQHRWPGSLYTSGHPDFSGFDASGLVWQFFKNYSL